MNTLMTNIDPIRAEIMRLENEDVFDPEAWDRVFHALQVQGRVAGYEDAWRRMRTALDKASTVLGEDPIFTEFVSVETAVLG